jgi:hypothetical protein
MNGFNIRSAADWRAAGYVLWPALASLLVARGVLDDSHAALWGGLAAALLGPGIAFVFARDVSTFRAAFHALALVAQALLVGYGLLSDHQVGIWLPVVTTVVAFLTGGVAAANTNTTPALDARHSVPPIA